MHAVASRLWGSGRYFDMFSGLVKKSRSDVSLVSGLISVTDKAQSTHELAPPSEFLSLRKDPT